MSTKISVKDIKKTLILILINLLSITIAQMLGNFYLIFVALGFYLIVMLCSSNKLVFPMLLLYLPWSPILKLSPSSISFYSIATIFILIKILTFYRKVSERILFSLLGLLIITLLAKLLNGYNISPSYFMFFAMLVAFPLLYNYLKADIDFELCAVFFSLGIIVATIASTITVSDPDMVKYIKIIEQENIGITRLCGFYGDPNFYSSQVLVAFGAILLLMAQKGKENIFHIVLAISLLVCGFSSVSKSFLICTVIVFLLWFISLLFNRSSRLLIISIIVTIVFIVLLNIGVFDDSFSQYRIRFDNSTDASTLTTGRIDLWNEYIKFVLENPLDLLFGQGYTSVFKGVQRGSHSTPIQLLYQFGILGSIIFMFWLGGFKAKEKILNRNPLIYLMWLVSCFGMWIGLDMLFFDDLFIMITMFAFGCDCISKTFNKRST